MIRRMSLIRERDLAYSEALDRLYAEFHDEIFDSYRRFRFRAFGLQAKKYRYDRLRNQQRTAWRWQMSESLEEDLERLTKGFNDEIRPLLRRHENHVMRLSGQAVVRYEDWRELLNEIDATARGAPLDEEPQGR